MKKKCTILLIIICLLQVYLGITYGLKKNNFHVDEIYTFGLANNTPGTVMSIPQGELIQRTTLDRYVTVDRFDRFDYKNVWTNQSGDVHPPFYYTLIHTICSFSW